MAVAPADFAACFRPDFIAHYLSIVAQCTGPMLDLDGLSVARSVGSDERSADPDRANRAARRIGCRARGYGKGAALVPLAEALGEPYAGVHGGDAIAPLAVVRPRAPRRMVATIRIIDERIASGCPVERTYCRSWSGRAFPTAAG